MKYVKQDICTQIINIFIVYIINRGLSESVAEAVRDSVMDSNSEAPWENTSASRKKPRIHPHAEPEEPPETQRRVQLYRTEGNEGMPWGECVLYLFAQVF